ncbi:MAG: HipA domain-containing protein [Ilumatobacteraceae bacterium]
MVSRRLQIWWDDVHVAEIAAPRPWDLRIRFTSGALERWPTNTPVLSCSVPVQRRPIAASAFLKGLLPEGQHLQALASVAGVATNDAFGLLRRYGRDVAGALVITDDERRPDQTRWGIEPYDEDTWLAELAGLDDGALGVRPDSELSIAGLQNKLLLVSLDGGRWGRPIGGRPSTHILKVDDPRHPGLVAAEAECLRLARAAGVTDLEVERGQTGDIEWLIVPRYDRAVELGVFRRVHQEDACQALGIDADAHRGRAKYEDAGGPSWSSVAALLSVHAVDAEGQLVRLLDAAVFTLLIGNADAHGKNLSLLHDTDGHIALAPLYDTVPTHLWPGLRRSPAMAVDGVRDFAAMGVDRLVREAGGWGLGGDRARRAVTDLAERVRAEVGNVIQRSDLAESIIARADALLVEG